MIAETYRDPMERSFILRCNGQDVHILDVVAYRGGLHRASEEWRQANELWRKEREECGCVDCMKDIRGPNAGGDVLRFPLSP